MSKTMYAIEMDFANALRQADELDQTADSLDTLVNSSFRACQQGIASGWKGENAAVFCRKGDTIGENIRKTVSDLRNTAGTIRQIARNTYLAERRNYETAQMRNYRS